MPPAIAASPCTHGPHCPAVSPASQVSTRAVSTARTQLDGSAITAPQPRPDPIVRRYVFSIVAQRASAAVIHVP